MATTKAKSSKTTAEPKTIPETTPKNKIPTTNRSNNNILITAALPYANGPIHIGHLLEYIQADIFSRYLKLAGKKALYICASDMHGTPIEVNAKKAGKEPEQFALEFWKEHQQDFSSYLIQFDNYYKTHSPENKEIAELFYKTLKSKNLIYKKKVEVVYCNNCKRYLPDRYVKGTCPFCKAEDQYGDVCEKCSKALKGTDLINPKCSLCGKTPMQKESEHYFFKLSAFSKELKAWFNDNSALIQPEVKNWLNEWMERGLDDWCVSRDAPYFGFEIPDSKKETGEKKYFYVWLDAPIGYISSTKNYTDAHKETWEEYWKKGQVYHFIGKDIAYFHFLFWPAMLLAMDIPLPKLTVHGFITVNGEKMSKSRGTFFTAKDFLKLYSAEMLRFYYASHLDRKVVDVDLNFDDFKSNINTVLVGNLSNLCYRVLTFAQKNYGAIETIAEEKELIAEITKLVEETKKYYSEMDFKSAVRTILKISDLGNIYFQKAEPWKNKEDVQAKKAVGFCVNIARSLAILVIPILPEFSHKVSTALNETSTNWKLSDIKFNWSGKLNTMEMPIQKIETIPAVAVKFPMHLRVGKIISVGNHPNADSLYLMKVDFGSASGIGVRQVVAGLKKYISADKLQDQKAVFCVNLKPAKLRGEMSEAMILAADDREHVVPLFAIKSEVGEEVIFESMNYETKEITFDDLKNFKIAVKAGNVFCDGKKLRSKAEEIKVIGVKDGAEVR